MGTEIAVIGNGDKAAQLFVTSDTEWTSAIVVQGHQRVNVGIVVGDQISDILSAATFSAAISATASVFSGTVTLQRRMPEEDASYHWRDVASWTINSSGGGAGGSENITASPEPESAQYRCGIKAAADYTGGVTHLRVGTS